MNGYNRTIDRETKRHNELHATVEIVIANPDNKFWQARLAAVRDNIDTDHLAELVDICNTDPAHILNTEAEADWLQADNAAGLYGEADPRTPAQRAADEDWQDEQNTREAVRPG